MSAVVAPLDPSSPRGIATAERLEAVLGEIWHAICERRAAKNPTSEGERAR